MKKYENAEMDILYFEAEDIITESPTPGLGEDDLPWG